MREIFSDVVRRPVKVGPRAWYTLPVSIAAHVAVGTVVIVVPMMAADVLPSPATVLPTFVTPPPPPPPPAPAAVKAGAPAPPSPEVAFTEAADKIADEVSRPALPDARVGVEGGVPTGIAFGTGSASVLPLPPQPAPIEPLLIGGRIKMPAKIKDVRPVYPAIALASGLEGRVIISAIIGADGRVKEARIQKSIPLLDRAALDAVLQWQFTPTLLNGVPVPVIMTVTVNFALR